MGVATAGKPVRRRIADGALAGGIVLLQSLLVSAAGAATPTLTLADSVAMALQRNPQVTLQRLEIDAAQGRQLQESGRFDWNTSAAAGYERKVTPLSYQASADMAQNREVAATYRAAVSRQLRSGASAVLSLDGAGTQQRDRAPYAPQRNLVRFDLALTVPLARGADGRAVTAYEDAAQLQAQAAQFDLRDQLARTVSGVVQAYWLYETRVALEKVAATSVERSAKLLQSIQALVDAQERPRGDLVLLRADHADKSAAHDAAVLAVAEARQALGRQLGMDAREIDALPAPGDALPPVIPMASLSADQSAVLAQAAQARRPDLRALELKQQAAQRYLHAARDDLKPQLDLKLGAGTARASDGGPRFGFLDEAGRTASPSVRASLNFQFPLENRNAKGALLDRSAQLAQLDVQWRDLQAGVGAGVAMALENLARTGTQFSSAQAALGLYQEAVAQEIVKQRNGIATLIDVINVETRYVSAQINVLQLQLAYAQAVARLRYESGTLLPPPAPDGLPEQRLTLDPADLAGLGPLRNLLLPASR